MVATGVSTQFGSGCVAAELDDAGVCVVSEELDCVTGAVSELELCCGCWVSDEVVVTTELED